MGFMDMFKERKQTPEVAVIADPYKDVREPLLKYLNENIGKVNTYQGELTAGKTAQEDQSLNLLKQYTDSNPSSLRTAASGEISKTLSGNYDPTSSPYYQAVKAEAAKNLKASQENVASSAAGAGRFWSGARLETQAKQATDVNDALNTLVYGLADKERQRRIDIIPQALNAATQEEVIPLQKAEALQSLGSLDRNIQQQRLDALYNEWNRATNEQPLAVGSLAQGLALPPMYGNVTRKPSTAMAMWGELNPLVGSYNNQKYGYSNNQSSLSDMLKMFAQMGGTGGA